jgi:hypothetical protein
MEKTMNKIFARNCHYNAVQMMNEIYDLVKSKGGYLVSEWQKELTFTEVHNRTNTELPAVITPFWGASTTYMKFYLDGFVYYLEFPANIFDSIVCGKVKVDKYLVATQRYYCDPINNSSDAMDRLYNITDGHPDAIKSIAQDVLETILAQDHNPYTVTEARSVPNTYDGGYHTELVPVKYKCMYFKLEAGE